MPVSLQLTWGLSLVLEAALAVRIRIAHRRREYPIFFWYLVGDVALSLCMFVIAAIYPESAYWPAFTVYGPLMSFALMVVCLEAGLKLYQERPLSGLYLAWSIGFAGILTGLVLLTMGQLHFTDARQLIFPFKSGLSTMAAILLLNLAAAHHENCNNRCVAEKHAWMLTAYLAVHSVYYLSITDSANMDVPMMLASVVCWCAWMLIW